MASRLLAELVAEDAFDREIANSGDKLARLAAEALEEHGAGQTQELDPEWRSQQLKVADQYLDECKSFTQ